MGENGPEQSVTVRPRALSCVVTRDAFVSLARKLIFGASWVRVLVVMVSS